MAVQLEIGGRAVTMDAGTIHCEDEPFQEFLTAIPLDAPLTSEPNPDLFLAKELITRLGAGKIIQYDEPVYTKEDEGKIF